MSISNFRIWALWRSSGSLATYNILGSPFQPLRKSFSFEPKRKKKFWNEKFSVFIILSEGLAGLCLRDRDSWNEYKFLWNLSQWVWFSAINPPGWWRRLDLETFRNKGVFLVKTNNAFVPVKRHNSVNTYSRFSTVPWGSEQSEWASPWTDVAKRSPAERVSGVSGASERM